MIGLTNIPKMIKRFFIYGLIGCLMEVLFTGVSALFRGNLALMSYTSIWMVMIYGLAIFLEPIQDKTRKYNWIVRGLIYMICIFSAEYIAGFLLKLVNISVWNYEDGLNINGYITLWFIPVWFAAGLIFEKIRERLDRFSVLQKETARK